jgi:type I restriction enzyme S subunit
MNDKNKNKTGYKKTSVGWIPADWDLKTLGEIGSFSKGKGISNSEKLEFGYPCITYGDIYTKYDVQIKKFFSFIDEKSAKSSQRIYKGCILFAGSGDTLDDIGKCVAFDNNDEAYAGGDIIIFTPR